MRVIKALLSWSRVVIVCILAMKTAPAAAQQTLVVVKATSSVVDVRDGDDFFKAYWHITPQVKPDVYPVNRFKGTKRVAFYTDCDSVSFTVQPGKTYDFIILLNGKDTAYTQLSTLPPVPLHYTKACRNCTADTIPFTLGWNNSIRLKGRINSSQLLDLIFDTGANGIVLSANALSKQLNLKIDETITGSGIGGTSQDGLSTSNELQLAGLTWPDIRLTVKYEGKPAADGVIGYNVFDGNIVELDYDKNLLIVQHRLPEKVTSYSKHDLRFRDGLSYVKLSLNVGKKISEAWFDFDTGGAISLFVNNDFATSAGLYGVLKKLGTDDLKGAGPNRIAVETVQLPKLAFGPFELTDVPMNMETASSTNGPAFNIVGSDILKRFNCIIDYQNDVVYVKPNSHTTDLYFNQKVTYAIWSGGAVLIAFLATGFIIYRKRRSNKNRNNAL